MKKRSLTRIATRAEQLESRTLFAAINFASHVDFAVGTSPVALVAADFNADGNQDLAVADNSTNRVYVYFGSGNGAFTTGPMLALSAPPTAIITGDFDGNGLTDIAVATTASSGSTGTAVDIFLNAGGGNFGVGQISSVESGATAGEPVALTAADFNRDGHLDLAVTDYTSEAVSVLLGNGNGTFATPVVYQSDAHPNAIVAADFNNDTYPDLAVTSTITDNTSGTAVTSNQVSLLIGSATGDFTAGPNIQLTGIPTGITTANLTGATTPGLIVGDTGGGGTVLTNSSGTFSTSAIAAFAAGSSAVAAADFNLDGDADFVSADGGSSTSLTTDSVTVITGAGSGLIGNASQFSVGIRPEDVVVADFNNDGKPDIATANQLGSTVSILLNTTSIPLVSTSTAVTPSATSTPAGSAVTLTATITPSSVSPLTGEEMPTGTVNFYDGTTLLSSVTLATAATTAVFSTTNLTIGNHTLRAKYMGDDGYAVSTSAPFVETITPTATEGPDLVGTFVSSTLPATLAPGESGNVTIRVTNQGNTIASGTILDALRLSLDGSVDSSDAVLTLKGGLAKAGLKLKPGQSKVLTGTITIPQNTPLASYFLLVSLNTTDSLAESVATNNLVVSPATYAVEDVFGTVAGRKNVVLQVADNSGTIGAFKLSGPGNGTVNVGDDGVDLILDGTTAASSLSVTTSRGKVFQLTELTADSVAGKLNLATTNLTSSVSLPDGVTTLSLASTAGSLNIGGGPVTTLALGSVSLASLAANGGIHTLTDTGWLAGTIGSPWIGSLVSKGAFSAGLQLSGVGAPGNVALNSAAITGSLGSATTNWNIIGNISKLTASAFVAGWILDETGTIKLLSSSGVFNSTVNSNTISSIQVKGAATGATFNATASIGAITIHGPVDATTKFISPALPKKAVLGGVSVDPSSDPHFET